MGSYVEMNDTLQIFSKRVRLERTFKETLYS